MIYADSRTDCGSEMVYDGTKTFDLDLCPWPQVYAGTIHLHPIRVVERRRAMDESNAQSKIIYRPAGTAPATWAMGGLFERLGNPGETGGLDLAVVTEPPGMATPLHRHTREAEAFFVLDGRMTYRAGDDLYELSAGDFICLPVGIPHAFRVIGRSPARFLGFTNPGGLFDMYFEIGITARERRLPGPDGQPMEVELAKWKTAGPRYGLEVVGPPIPE